MGVDVLIFGGGVAGLWVLDELHRAGMSVLLAESRALGAGQTIASQGIIHGGIKYTLAGLLSESARSIREMPGIWRECLRGAGGAGGAGGPDLSNVRVLSEVCHLWRTDSLSSRAGLAGAAGGLRSEVTRLAAADRPPPLVQCPGDVFAVREQVLDVASLLSELSRPHESHLVKVEEPGVDFAVQRPGEVNCVRLAHPAGGSPLELKPCVIVLTAGAGNAELRRRVGLSPQAMQRRPLHQVLVRGRLPLLFGHCVDGAKTRATITSAVDAAGRTVWNVGGQIAEDGVNMDPPALVAHARRELASVLPGVTLAEAEWTTVRVDRAEQATPAGLRPAGPHAKREGNVITAWPTKLALAPQLARMARELLAGAPRRPPAPLDPARPPIAPDWPRPRVAAPPWEEPRDWSA
ncbi:MAG: FAD-dependent oxidoreductase [Phycisphaerales bacterium]|nr:FAD-dependent oxidoreductase [Phycisphaerales bacterium]